jgi:hypothetical protein
MSVHHRPVEVGGVKVFAVLAGNGCRSIDHRIGPAQTDWGKQMIAHCKQTFVCSG